MSACRTRRGFGRTVELLCGPFFHQLGDFLVVLLFLLELPGEILMQIMHLRVKFDDLLLPFDQFQFAFEYFSLGFVRI